MTTITRISDRDRELMRRSALVQQGPKDEEQAGGSFPFAEIMKALGDPQDPTNVSFPFLRRMRRDHMVSMGLHFIAMPIVQAPWYYEAQSAKVAAFADNLIRPIYGELVLTILRFLWAGYSPAVKNFEVIQPTWKYRDIDGETKPVWDNGDIGVMVYKEILPLRPETARPAYTRGRFSGIEYDDRFGGGSFIINGESTNKVDLLHSVWAVHDKEGEDGSPFGFPRIAHCAPIFHMYRYIWTLLARAFENSADPGPVVRYPRDEIPGRPGDPRGSTNVKRALKVGSRKRSGATVALPSEVYKDFQDRPTSTPLWAIEYPKGDTDFESIMKFLGYLESSKLRALWLQEQGLIGSDISGGTSNRNVMESAGDQRDASQAVLMGQIDRFIDDTFVKPAVQMAFPTYTGSATKRTIGMGSGSADIIRQFFQLIGQEDWRTFGVDARKLAEANGFPMTDPDEHKRMLDEAAKQASQSATPTVEPTKGRRALVTQTGFDETTYVQVADEVHLSTDGDFVASLPKLDVFADTVNVAHARALRATSSKFLNWAYRDFAIYISKQQIPEFGTVVSTDLYRSDTVADVLADEELLRGDRVVQWVERAMKKWMPKQETIETYSKDVRRTLGKVFDRSAGQHIKNLRSNAKLSSVDKIAADWLDDQGAEAVKSIMNTTREQLARVLADGVREGKSAKEIAADIRTHFEAIPASRAVVIARTEVPRAYNFATVRAGLAAGVQRAQLIDGEDHDSACKKRNGKIVPLDVAADEDLNHPQCVFQVRLLPRAGANLEVRYAALDGGALGRYDDETETILLAPGLSMDDEAAYLLAVGASFV